MKMAKSLKVVMLLASTLSMAACGSKESTVASDSSSTLTGVEAIIAEASKMDQKDLYKKALEELNGKKMYCVGNSSRGKKGIPYFLAYLRGNRIETDESGNTVEVADDDIRAAFPYYNESFNGEIDWQQPKNNKIFDQITGDVKGAHTLSMTLIQDGAQIQSKMLDTGYLLKYVPKEWKGSADDSEPLLALQSLNKVFEFNNLDTTKSYTNVWDFVADGETPLFMGVNSEPVGRNFLVQLTAPKYATMMKEAYDQLTGDKKAYVDAALEAVKDVAASYDLEGDYVNYSLAFDYLWMKQYNEQTDDGPICNTLVTKSAAGQSGLLVYSKLRSVNETDDSSKKNVTVAAYQDNYVGIGGFMYKHYMAVLKTSPLPWTSCALIHFLTTTENGFKAWGNDIGGYASDDNVRAKFDHTNDGGTDYSVINDKGYSWWKERCVVEDPSYVASKALLPSWFDSLRS